MRDGAGGGIGGEDGCGDDGEALEEAALDGDEGEAGAGARVCESLLMGFVGFEGGEGVLHGGERGVLGDDEEGGAVGTDEVGEGGDRLGRGTSQRREAAGLEVVGDTLELGLVAVVQAPGGDLEEGAWGVGCVAGVLRKADIAAAPVMS